jgi:hypothetical protein
MVISVGEATCALPSVCMQPEQKSAATSEIGTERVTVFQDMNAQSSGLSASNALPLQPRDNVCLVIALASYRQNLRLRADDPR